MKRREARVKGQERKMKGKSNMIEVQLPLQQMNGKTGCVVIPKHTYTHTNTQQHTQEQKRMHDIDIVQNKLILSACMPFLTCWYIQPTLQVVQVSWKLARKADYVRRIFMHQSLKRRLSDCNSGLVG